LSTPAPGLALSFRRERTMKKADKVAALELLMGIKGVGQATAEKLLHEFKSVDKISKADKDALLDAGLNSRAAAAVLKWSKTQDKQRKKPKKAAAPKPAPEKKAAPKPAPEKKVASAPKPAPEKKVASAPKPVVKKAAAPKPQPSVVAPVPAKESAARIPVPLPFGNAKDVRVRTTPPPEVVDIASLKSGGPVKTKPIPQGRVKPKPVKPALPKLAKPAPPKPVKAARPRPTKRGKAAPSGALGTALTLHGSDVQVFVDRADRIQSPRGTLVRIYDAAHKPLGYGKVLYGKAHLVQKGR
jgi:hypothetical protein